MEVIKHGSVGELQTNPKDNSLYQEMAQNGNYVVVCVKGIFSKGGHYISMKPIGFNEDGELMVRVFDSYSANLIRTGEDGARNKTVNEDSDWSPKYIEGFTYSEVCDSIIAGGQNYWVVSKDWENTDKIPELTEYGEMEFANDQSYRIFPRNGTGYAWPFNGTFTQADIDKLEDKEKYNVGDIKGDHVIEWK